MGAGVGAIDCRGLLKHLADVSAPFPAWTRREQIEPYYLKYQSVPSGQGGVTSAFISAKRCRAYLLQDFSDSFIRCGPFFLRPREFF
jgi:hypothetical protein